MKGPEASCLGPPTGDPLAHLSAVNDDYVAKKKHESYKRCVPVSLGHVDALALVDSGNVWRNAISCSFYYLMKEVNRKLRLRPVGQSSVGTAKHGARLKVLGETVQAVPLKFRGSSMTLYTKPVVIEGLAMDINLAGPFLQEHKIDQLHSKGVLRMGTHHIPMVASLAGGAAPIPGQGFFAYVNGQQVVPARAASPLQLRLGRTASRGSSENAILESLPSFMEATDLHPSLAALVTWDTEGLTTVRVLNTQDEPIVVEDGRRYGISHTAADDVTADVQAIGAQDA